MPLTMGGPGHLGTLGSCLLSAVGEWLLQLQCPCQGTQGLPGALCRAAGQELLSTFSRHVHLALWFSRTGSCGGEPFSGEKCPFQCGWPPPPTPLGQVRPRV